MTEGKRQKSYGHFIENNHRKILFKVFFLHQRSDIVDTDDKVVDSDHCHYWIQLIEQGNVLSHYLDLIDVF